MTAPGSEPGAILDDVGRVRARTRRYRNGHWFASVVFGVVILGALPFYVQPTLSSNLDCRPFGREGRICEGAQRVGSAPLGRAFAAQPLSSLGSWSNLYWAIAIVTGFAAVVAYYHVRAKKVGVQGRLWPAVVAGIVILGLVMWVNNGSNAEPADFWIRGTSALVVIAIGLLVLSALERSRPFVVFSVGFLGLALLSCLYNVVNLFHRLGIGGPFNGGDDGLPNLVLPGAYLIVGGLCFLLARRWQLQVRIRLNPVPT